MHHKYIINIQDVLKKKKNIKFQFKFNIKLFKSLVINSSTLDSLITYTFTDRMVWSHLTSFESNYNNCLYCFSLHCFCYFHSRMPQVVDIRVIFNFIIFSWHIKNRCWNFLYNFIQIKKKNEGSHSQIRFGLKKLKYFPPV